MDDQAYREELIQVAAVAVAMVEDLFHGQTELFGTRQILNLVEQERFSQERKWGPQHHDPNDWLHILMEEVGEVAEEIDGPDPKSLRQVIVNAGRGSRRYLKEVFGQ